MISVDSALWAIYFFILGSAVGSFLNVVIARTPYEISIISPRSRCPKCGEAIRARDNIPVLSWLLLGARCRSCGEPISFRYPLIELTTALIFAALYFRFGLTPVLPVWFVFCSAMIAVFVIDLEHMIIPDSISLNLIPIGVASAIVGILPSVDWKASLYGFLLGGAVLYIPALAYQLFRGVEGLGGGDVKLLAMIGSFFGPYGVVFVLLTSSLSGSIIGILGIVFGKQGSATPIPYGPFLVAGALLYIFAGPEIVLALFGKPAMTTIFPHTAP